MEQLWKVFTDNCRTIWKERNLISRHRPIFVAFALVVMLVTGAIVGIGEYAWFSSSLTNRENELRIKNATIEGLQNKPPALQPSDAPRNIAVSEGILDGSRRYSPDNKNAVSGRLDKISEAINKADQEMLIPADKALNQRFLARPVAEAGAYLETLDSIKVATKRMDAALYDDLLGKERDYRVEMNAILFPKEPLVNFMIAADEYRNGISVWMKLSNSIAEDETNREFRRLVMAHARSFSVAKGEFLKWLSQRQELVGRARRELRS